MNNNTTIQLIGYGKAKATEAKNFKIGSVLLWNYGGTSTIKKVIKETAKFITFQTEALDWDGVTLSLYERRLKKDRLVAFVKI